MVWETLRLTPNGKGDRKARPAPERESQDGGEYVAPGNGLEQELAAMRSEYAERLAHIEDRLEQAGEQR